MTQQEYVDLDLGRIRAEHAPRLVDGVCHYYGYRETLEDGTPNPETKVQYAKRKLRQQIVIIVKKAELDIARQQLGVNDIEVTE